jgi:hypothetical protein
MMPGLPGEIRQAGYVVRDLDRAIADWCALGVGPWFTDRDVPHAIRFRGEPAEPHLSIAIANSGGLQIELIQQHDDVPTAYREFLDSGCEGFHHFAWWTEDMPSVVGTAVAAGWSLLQEGSGVAPWAYFEATGITSTVVEVGALNPVILGVDKMLRSAATTWDRVTEPVRPLR